VVAKGMNRFDIGKTAPKQPLWEKLSDRVLCVVACNPNPFTLNGTCCYLVGTGSRRILIDTGEENVGHPQFMAALEDCMACNNIEGFQLILITHFHHDHYGGVAGLLERFGKDIPVGKLPSSDLFWLTLDIVRDRGLVQYLEDSSGTPFFPLQSFREQTVPFEYTRVWPDEEAESGNVLSWDPVGRTKEELIRDYSWVKRSWEHHTRMTQKYNFQPLWQCDVLTTEGRQGENGSGVSRGCTIGDEDQGLTLETEQEAEQTMCVHVGGIISSVHADQSSEEGATVNVAKKLVKGIAAVA